MDSGDESDDDTMPTKMLEEIRYRSQSHTNINRKESRYKVCDSIKQRQSEKFIGFGMKWENSEPDSVS